MVSILISLWINKEILILFLFFLFILLFSKAFNKILTDSVFTSSFLLSNEFITASIEFFITLGYFKLKPSDNVSSAFILSLES